ncbi:MAG: NUDIX domain-containing protein [Candidatus Latescibacteria bacterium]|nr:NUDIX domain-containing protein [Candidatus Latescibacterota bacterium]
MKQNLPRKACPVILRLTPQGQTQILAFTHPSAGKQLVKGTIEPGEAPADATLRELAEESGITQAKISQDLGPFEVGPPHQLWYAFLCQTGDLPDAWTFFTADGGGLEFGFFWHPLEEPADDGWRFIFGQALDRIRRALG